MPPWVRRFRPPLWLKDHLYASMPPNIRHEIYEFRNIYIGGWGGGGVQPGNRFVSFVRAYARFVGVVESRRKCLSRPFPFSLMAPRRFPFSLIASGRFPFPLSGDVSLSASKWNRSETEVKSKWNRSETEVQSKRNRSDTEVIIRSEIKSETEVKSKWYRSEFEVKSKWNQSETKVNSKWNRSETEVKSKWNPSEI